MKRTFALIWTVSEVVGLITTEKLVFPHPISYLLDNRSQCEWLQADLQFNNILKQYKLYDIIYMENFIIDNDVTIQNIEIMESKEIICGE
jgi:hypothetical protein